MKTNLLVRCFLVVCMIIVSFVTTQKTYASDQTQMQYYIDKYHFSNSTTSVSMSAEKLQQLKDLAPFVGTAVAAYNKRFGEDMDPQLVMWWTASEDTQSRTHSNCANVDYVLHNCSADQTFWQLGPAGIQFKFIGYFLGSGTYGDNSKVAMLKLAFQDLHGDPGDTKWVQKIGQAVLDYDQSQNTTPKCGGLSCTFPALTIDQIMNDVHCGTDPCAGGTTTTNNWWASVIARDPAVSGYLQARGLWGLKQKGCAGINDSSYCSGGGYIPRLNDWMYTILQLHLDYSSTKEPGGNPLGQDTINVIPNFKDAYSDYYNWAKGNLFDGLEFFTQTQTSTTAGTTTATTCSLPTPTSVADAQQQSQKLWGISLDGSVLTITRAKQIFTTLCLLNSSTKWASLMNSKTTPIHIHINPGGSDCRSGAYGSGDVDLNGYCGPILTDKFLISHELGHQVSFRNTDLEKKFASEIYLPSTKVVRHGFTALPTWNCQFDYGTGPYEYECWADMIGSYLTYKDMRNAFGRGPFGNGLTDTFSEYPIEYSDYYNFVKTNIFGGTEFYDTSASGGPTGSNTNTCGGFYDFTKDVRPTQKGYSPRHNNYADQNCEFAGKDPATQVNLVADQVKQLDPSRAKIWEAIASCESGTNPMTWTDMVGSVHTPDPGGAYGLFQMGSGRNGQYDHGDVYWKMQISNAVNYAKNLTNLGSYWACAQ